MPHTAKLISFTSNVCTAPCPSTVLVNRNMLKHRKMTNWMIWNVLQLLFCIFTPPVNSAFHSVALKLSYYEDRNKSIAFQSADAKKMVTPATIFLYAWDQYQSCFSLRSRAAIWFISSSVREKPKRARFSRIWSGLLEPGMTTMPRCRFQRRMTWAEVARRFWQRSRI